MKPSRLSRLSRRGAIRGLGGLGSIAATTGVGCMAPSASEDDCIEGPSTGAGSYCLVEGIVVRVAGAASLAIGEAMLASVDDASAVIVVRDADGWFARSAICTHACCVVSLCQDPACTSLTTTPDTCGIRRVATGTALCPCHGSRFTLADGVPIEGPAVTPLPALALEIDAQDALVDLGNLVDASDRFS